MVFKIIFDQADKNHDGKLDATEFEAAIRDLAATFDLNHDGYISNGKGSREDGVNEFTRDFYDAVPFDQKKIFNTTILKKKDNAGYSFWYQNDDRSTDAYDSYTKYAWQQAGGKISTYLGACGAFMDCASSFSMTGALTKDDIRKSGVTFIQVD